MIDHSSHSKRPSITTEESDSATIQISKCPLYIIQRSEQISLITSDPVQLQVQKGYAWNDLPTPKENVITFSFYLQDVTLYFLLYKLFISKGATSKNYIFYSS
jgi:hypothetical protein